MKSNFKLISWLLIVPLVAISFMAAPIKAQEKIYDLKVYEYNDHARINWYTDSQYINELNYGTSESYGSRILRTNTSDWASFELTALTPGTTYYYKALAKNKSNQEVANLTGEFTTLGQKPASQVYKQFFYLNFNSNLYSFNGQFPYEVVNPENIKFVEPSVYKGALKITDKNSYVIYKADPLFNGSYGTVSIWVRLESFDKDMTIFETADGKYGLYYDSQSSSAGRLVARTGYDAKKTDTGEIYYNIKSTGSDVNSWLPGEWRQITLTWNGKLSGTAKLYLDGEKRAEGSYANGGSTTTFMVGNNYAHTQNFSNGQIDDFKIYDWDMDSTSVRNEYKWLALNQTKNLLARPTVAGVSVRNFKVGTFIQVNNDDKIYLVGRYMEKIHIADMSAFRRLGSPTVTLVTPEELSQYSDGGKFYSWSRLPDGLFVKNGGNSVYYLWDGQKKFVPNENTFLKSGANWSSVVNISYDELNEYPDGPNFK